MSNRGTYNKAILRESTQMCLPTKARTLEHSLYRMPQFQEAKFPWTFRLGTVPRFSGPVALVTTGVDVAIWKWVGGPILQPCALSNLWIWFLQVLPPFCWSFQLISSPLSPGSLSHPRTLGLFRGPTASLTPMTAYFDSFSCPPISSLTWSCASFPLSSPLSHPVSSLPLSPRIILFCF